MKGLYKALEDIVWLTQLGLSMLLPLLLSVLGACIVGLLLVYQNSRSLYDPLKQLIAAVGGPSEMDLPQDEYRWLAGHYDKLLEQREEVYEQVAAIRPLLQKKFLLSLLNGESSPDEIMYQMSVLELPFQMAMFGTFLLQIDDYYSLPIRRRRSRNSGPRYRHRSRPMPTSKYPASRRR